MSIENDHKNRTFRSVFCKYLTYFKHRICRFIFFFFKFHFFTSRSIHGFQADGAKKSAQFSEYVT